MNPTVSFIFIIIAAIALFDVWIIFKKGKYESISAHIIRASKKAPLLPFILGVVIGHLLWSMDTADWKNPPEVKTEVRIDNQQH